MSANASPRQLRSAALGRPLGHFTRHELEMDCGSPGCQRARRYAVSNLAGIYGCDVLLSTGVRSLRCQECGGKAASVVLLHSIGLRKPVMVRVPLKGPEAKD